MNLPANQPHDVRVLERLQADGTISASQREQVLNHARRVDDMTCVDAIVDLGVLDEQTILQYLATLYRTRFVSTKKLAAAVVDARTLAQVPQRIAEQIAVCPILFDVRNGSLSVVCDNFEGEDIGKQVQMASGVREVKTYLARRAAIRALIRKHYLNESSAFVELQLRTNQPVGTDIDPAQPFYSGAGATVGHPSLDNYMSHPPRFSSPPELQPVPRRVDSLIPQRERVISSFTIEAPEIVSNLRGEVDEVQRDVAAHEDDSVPNQRYLETLNVLTALLENSREGMRGHSAQVARLCKKICERVGLKDAQMHGILVAAYLHDIGKASNYHLTAFNVAQYEGHRTKAEKTHMTPLRIFEAADLPESAIKTLTHMYEAFNGQGFPGRLSGKDIPLGARILAIVETYVDFTTHEKNPARKILDSKEACEYMGKLKGSTFDPNLFDLFQLEVLGDDMKAKLLADRSTILVVDPDPEETTVLELRLIEHGFDVVVARTSDDARKKAKERPIDAVLSEVVLTPKDGFALMGELMADGLKGPFVFHTAKGDRASVTKGFDLGAKDYVVKPASADVVAAKMKQILTAVESQGGERAKGVSGTLQEMSLPDVIQILSNGRKSGQLTIRAAGGKGEILFGDGAIWDASYGAKKAQEAVYDLLALTEGDFTLDLSAKPETRVIQESPESLLLEGMRRLDEAGR